MILTIDTATRLTKLALLDSSLNLVDGMEEESSFDQSEKLISLVEVLLRRNNLTKYDIKIVAVNPGPGSYTGLRVGITTANFLAFSLNVPVADIFRLDSLKKEKYFTKPILPAYGNCPHITMSKSRLN